MAAERGLMPKEAFIGSTSVVDASQVSWTSRNWLCYWAKDGENSALGGENPPKHHLHLWAAAEPIERCILRLFPAAKEGTITGSLRLRNPRGELVNECSIATRPGQLAQLPIASFLDECETDMGLRHAHLHLVTDSEVGGEIELSSHTRTSFMPPLHRFDDREPRAFPVTLSSSHHHVFALINPNDVQCSVKCRLYIGSRTPEEVCLIPPHGSVLLSPEVLFSPILRDLLRDGGEIQGYMRLMTRSAKAIGFQILEERTFESGEKVYGVVA